MTIKFVGKTMPRYCGIDGLGGAVDLQPGDTALVSDAVASHLVRVYSKDFAELPDAPAAPEEKADKAEDEPSHKPNVDKYSRKSNKTKTK